MTGKDKCKLLKDIRHKIADKYGIAYDPTPCNFDGECTGTCPKCEQEVNMIMQYIVDHNIQLEDDDFTEISKVQCKDNDLEPIDNVIQGDCTIDEEYELVFDPSTGVFKRVPNSGKYDGRIVTKTKGRCLPISDHYLSSDHSNSEENWSDWD